MFREDGILLRSTLLDTDGVHHGFSTRRGGVSTLPHTAAMNVAPGHGDTDETVRENIALLARAVTGGELAAENTVAAPQIHSATVRYVTAADGGTGVTRAAPASGDGFYTDCPGILLMVRTADCVPILFFARRSDGTPLVAAVHAGWRGTVARIAENAVGALVRLGAEATSVRAAIGPCIHDCCFEVQADFADAVAEAAGAAFADRHIRTRDGRRYADLPAMNREILLSAGVTEDNIDIAPYCTACAPDLFHSHRASRGLRGAMGAVIGIRVPR